MKLKKILILFSVMALFTSFIGCTDEYTTTQNSGIIIIDAFGTEIILDEPAQRIISTYSAITENIFALGAGDQLIGVGTSEVYPIEATQLPTFSYSKDDVEKFIAAKPDVIFLRKVIAGKYTDLVSSLENVGIIVIAMDNEGFHKYVTTIAKVVGKEDMAVQMLEEFDKELSALEAMASKVPLKERVNVFFESTAKDYRTASMKSIVYSGFKLIGLNNVADENMDKDATSAIAHFGEEYLLAEADNIDVYIAQHGFMNKTVTIESIKQRPGFNVIKAIKNGRIFIVDEKLISSPTFRQIEGLKQIFEYVYPNY